MTDFAVANERPGDCAKCSGTGRYRWGGATVNGQWRGHEGDCHSCKGTGRQSAADIRRNRAYNRYKIQELIR